MAGIARWAHQPAGARLAVIILAPSTTSTTPPKHSPPPPSRGRTGAPGVPQDAHGCWALCQRPGRGAYPPQPTVLPLRARVARFEHRCLPSFGRVCVLQLRTVLDNHRSGGSAARYAW